MQVYVDLDHTEPPKQRDRKQPFRVAYPIKHQDLLSFEVSESGLLNASRIGVLSFTLKEDNGPAGPVFFMEQDLRWAQGGMSC